MEHEHIIIVDAGVTKSVERTKHCLICCRSENQAKIANRSACAKHALNCRSCIAKGSIGMTLTMPNDIVEALWSQVQVDQIVPKITQEFFSCTHCQAPYRDQAPFIMS